jgi:hypothetical protein
MKWTKINEGNYVSRCYRFQINKTKRGWVYRFKRFVEGKILISKYGFKDLKSIKDAIDNANTHKMIELENKKPWLVSTCLGEITEVIEE